MVSRAQKHRQADDLIGDLCEAAGVSFPRSQARLLAKRFPTLKDILSAPRMTLANVPGVEPRTAAVISMTGEVMRQCLRQQWSDVPVLTHLEALLSYLQAEMAPLPQEEARLLFLDSGNRLILEEVMARGSHARVALASRDVVRRALELNASGFILVHNHPSGNPTPSKSDLDWTKELRSAAELFDIVMLDHLIIGRLGWVSLREAGIV
jgi:DNA repair protein RadC